MLKKELVYRHILSEALEHRQYSFTQLSLSRKFGFSLSTVNNALKPLEKMGGIEKRTRSFIVTDAEKILTYWATIRNIEKDLVYSTRSEMPPIKIEGEMPPGTIFTAYSAFRLRFDDAPADYGEAYVYADAKTLEEIKWRFPFQKGRQNLFVLNKDEFMKDSATAPLPQIYVDLWNLKEWYARDYLLALKARLLK
ncbi:MAG: hypothetical protein AABX01_06460 [Candidatus Micrarchaeota archaeon]